MAEYLRQFASKQNHYLWQPIYHLAIISSDIHNHSIKKKYLNANFQRKKPCLEISISFIGCSEARISFSVNQTGAEIGR